MEKKSSFGRVKLNLDVFKYMYMLKHEIDFYLVKKIFLTGFSRGKMILNLRIEIVKMAGGQLPKKVPLMYR